MNKRMFFVFFVGLLSTYTSHSQGFSVGGGLALGTEASIDNDLTGKSALGINARGVYKFTPRWGVTGGFTYFFSEAPEPVNSTVYQFNFDATYSIVNNKAVDFYTLLGFDVGYAKLENHSLGIEVDNSQVGLELGIGLITNFGAFFEAKAEGAFDQGQFTLGYLYKF